MVQYEGCRCDLSQGMRCTQTCATTQSEQTLMVPIEAPPFRGLRVNYTILKGHDDEDKDMKKRIWRVKRYTSDSGRTHSQRAGLVRHTANGQTGLEKMLPIEE